MHKKCNNYATLLENKAYYEFMIFRSGDVQKTLSNLRKASWRSRVMIAQRTNRILHPQLFIRILLLCFMHIAIYLFIIKLLLFSLVRTVNRDAYSLFFIRNCEIFTSIEMHFNRKTSRRCAACSFLFSDSNRYFFVYFIIAHESKSMYIRRFLVMAT